MMLRNIDQIKRFLSYYFTMLTTEKVQLILGLFKSGKWDISLLFKDESRFSNYQKYKLNGRQISDSQLVAELFGRQNGQPVRLFKHMMELLGKTHDDLIEATQTPLPYWTHIVFGSPDSRDIDLAYFVQSNEMNKSLWGPDMIYDHRVLKQKLRERGYDLEKRELDVTIVMIDSNGNIERTSKGACHNTQNIIWFTHHYHSGNQGMPISHPIPIEDFDVRDNCRSIAKFILDYTEDLVSSEDYTKIRQARRQAYGSEADKKGGLVARTKFIREQIYPLIDLQPPFSAVIQDRFKSLYMKLIQMSLMERSQLEYNKCLLAQHVDGLVDSQEAEWFLSRGQRGKFGQNKSFGILMKEFFRIVEEESFLERLVWKEIETGWSNSNPLAPEYDDHFWRLFCESPDQPSEELIEAFLSRHAEAFGDDFNSTSIGSLFVFPSSNLEQFPEHIRHQIHCESQRSPEWQELLRFYKCGRNTGVPDRPAECDTAAKFVRFYWNLIRGCLGEMIVQSLSGERIRFPDHTSQSVGLLVEEKGVKGTPGMAPDLLLVNEEEVIPVEIKCLTGEFIDNSKRRRGIHLAHKQVQQCMRLLKSSKGLIIFLYTNPNDFKVYSTQISF